MIAAKLLDRLPGVRKTGPGRWIAPCPAHEDRRPSLSIRELEDGSRFLRLEDLETSNGPDLRVIITDQPVSEDWHVWDDGAYLDLGPLKGNVGNSNYRIPRSVDLGDYRTAVIWCRRFSVGFGVAPLGPPA